MATIEFKHIDEEMPNINDAVLAVIDFLTSHHQYLDPFSRILTNMPLKYVGNPRFSKELETYLAKEFYANEYMIRESFSERDVKILIQNIVSYFAFYDDFQLQSFVKNNSRYPLPKNTPEEAQKAVFKRLKGYLFERLASKIIAGHYSGQMCRFETGCVIIIDGESVTEEYQGISRKTIDIAGLDSDNAGEMLECKVNPNGICEIAVKYSVHLWHELRNNGFAMVNVGFVTAGIKQMAKHKLDEKLHCLMLSDPGLIVYDMKDLCGLLVCE